MKTNIIKLLLLSFFTILTIYGCKKTDTGQSQTEELKGIELAKKNIAAEIKKLGGIPEVFPVNERIPMTYVDMNGDPVSQQQLSSNNLLSACSFDTPDYCDLTQYTRIYQCAGSSAGGYGFKIQFEYILSWNNTVVLTNPFNVNNKTKGRVRISSSTTTVYDVTTFDAQIIDLGTDPANASNNIYKVKFYCSTNILATYLTSSTYTLRLGATFASDCSSLENYAVAPADPAGSGFSPGTAYNPCNRNEKVWFQFPGALGQYVIGVAGYNVLSYSCDYSASFIKPDLQEVQYSLNGGTTWQDFINTPYASGELIDNSKYVRNADFAVSNTLSPGTYNVIIRYKNWKYTSTQTGWPLPTSVASCQTYGTSADNTYAYEYYPNIVVQ